MMARPNWPLAAAWIALLAIAPAEAPAYIGPGAGFAFGGALLVLLATFALAFVIVLAGAWLVFLRVSPKEEPVVPAE